MTAPSQAGIRVTLLGTGTPQPSPERFGPATLIEAGGQALLFDAGRGATIRLFQLGVPLGTVGPLFLTHFHSDHVSGIPDLWLTGWLAAPWARRVAPFRVVGPAGTGALMQNLLRAYAADIRIRIADEALPPAGIAIDSAEFDGDGIVHDQGGVRVSAFAVDHGPAIRPAYGYRIDHAGHSVVLSGDTRFCEAVIRQATGADLLIHEVVSAQPALAGDAAVRRVLDHHCAPRAAGEVFARARPKLALYTHAVLIGRPGVPAPSEAAIIAETRERYDGPLAIGRDLMRIAIDAAGLRLIEPA